MMFGTLVEWLAYSHLYSTANRRHPGSDTLGACLDSIGDQLLCAQLCDRDDCVWVYIFPCHASHPIGNAIDRGVSQIDGKILSTAYAKQQA